MPFTQTSTGLRYFHFDSLDAAGLVNAIFTRRGGASREPWSSLNLGGTVGDDPAAVAENRRLAFQTLGRNPESLYDVWQVHGTAVVCTDSPRPAQTPHVKADAILTQNPEVTLLMRFADCVPILLYDPVHRAVGLVHAGWRGTVLDVAARALEAMQARCGTRPAQVLAAIGPSIGPDHYAVGPDVVEQVARAFGNDADALLALNQGQPHLDLWQANQLRLEQAGVRQIEQARICTACHLEDWYSHRAEDGRTGRFAALLALG